MYRRRYQDSLSKGGRKLEQGTVYHFPNLLVVEQVFSIPGMGKFFVTSIQELDYMMIAGTTIFYGAFLIIMTLLVDIAYGIVDPRVKLANGKE